jgi:hypothetical protein
MPRPFTLAQALQNQAFLDRLSLSANIRLAAREVGIKYSTLQHRRSKHAGFAQQMEGVLAAAHARFHLAGGRRGRRRSDALPRVRRRRVGKRKEGWIPAFAGMTAKGGRAGMTGRRTG